MNPKPKLVGIFGLERAGKTRAARMCVRHHGFTNFTLSGAHLPEGVSVEQARKNDEALLARGVAFWQEGHDVVFDNCIARWQLEHIQDHGGRVILIIRPDITADSERRDFDVVEYSYLADAALLNDGASRHLVEKIQHYLQTWDEES